MSQLETLEGGEQAQVPSGYQAAGYRMEVGPLARRAAGLLVEQRLADDDTDIAEATLPLDGKSLSGSLDHEMGHTQPSENHESEQRTLANVYVDAKHHTVSLLLDDATANLVIYAVRVLMTESEAHAREVRLVGAALPPESYGAANRQAIASRHERIADRLRVLERNYRKVVS